jgi:hypothetical protein
VRAAAALSACLVCVACGGAALAAAKEARSGRGTRASGDDAKCALLRAMEEGGVRGPRLDAEPVGAVAARAAVAAAADGCQGAGWLVGMVYEDGAGVLRTIDAVAPAESGVGEYYAWVRDARVVRRPQAARTRAATAVASPQAQAVGAPPPQLRLHGGRAEARRDRDTAAEARRRVNQSILPSLR